MYGRSGQGNPGLSRHVIHLRSSTFIHVATCMLTPAAPDWTSLAPYPIIMKLFARISARVMVGPELCGDEWQRISLEYITAVLQAQMAVRMRYHPRFYWVAKYINPEIKELARMRREAAKFVQPVLRARYDAMSDRQSTEGTERPEDAIQWLLDEHAARGKKLTADELVQNVFITMVASIHSTAMLSLSVLFDLLDHPETLQEIREEIVRVKNEHMQSTGAWTRRALGELRTLDSFMRETLRVHSFTEGEQVDTRPNCSPAILFLSLSLSLSLSSGQLYTWRRCKLTALQKCPSNAWPLSPSPSRTGFASPLAPKSHSAANSKTWTRTTTTTLKSSIRSAG